MKNNRFDKIIFIQQKNYRSYNSRKINISKSNKIIKINKHINNSKKKNII